MRNMSTESSMTDERWAVIEEWPNYAVSDHGRVKRLTSRANGKAGTLLKPFMNNVGYFTVHLSHGPKRAIKTIHRLVAAAFIENPDGLPEVNHIDANRGNPHFKNLEWVTSSGNRYHAYKTGGLCAIGSKNGHSKLTEEAVLDIRSFSGHKKVLASKFGVSVATVNDVLARRTWTHI